MERRSGDTLRVVATVAVLGIHSAGAFEPALAEGGGGGGQALLAGTLSQLARFSVPIFLVLSGYGLASSRIRRGEKGLAGALAMWRRQFLRVGLPYVTFTVAGLLVQRHLGPLRLLSALVTGSGDYHLYFLSFLLQGYLLLPLLFRAGWGVVGGLFAVQVALSRAGVELGVPHLPAWICLHWLGYMALGCRLARGDAAGRADEGRAELWPHLTVLAAAWCVGDYFLHVRLVPDPGWANHFFRLPVMVYTVALLFAWRRRQPVWFGRHLGKLTAVSFSVYLIHPTLLRGLARTPLSGCYPLVFPTLVVAAFAAALLLDRILRPRVLRLLVGL